MSPLFVNAEGRERNAPTDRIREMRNTAQCIEYLLLNAPRPLPPNVQTDLRSIFERLVVLIELLEEGNLEGIVEGALSDASDYVGYVAEEHSR